jgi:two-component system, chemotaxis family, protein-glutamate methylesterase/glutaminase
MVPSGSACDENRCGRLERSGTASVPQRDLVVMGASAGGVEALMRIVARLPADLPATVLVVMHLAPDARSNLALILDRASPMRASTAQDGAPLEPSRILVAPPDHHLSVADGAVRVVRGPHENLHRPSVDVLFRSAALHHDGRTCGIVLSGALDDGTAGMRVVQEAGGLTIVQEPSDALVPSMPRSVMRSITPDHVLTADEIGARLPGLLGGARRARAAAPQDRTGIEQEIAMSQMAAKATDKPPPGAPSPFGCPECGGVLWEIGDNGDSRYRCRVGHAYTSRALLAAENAQLEDALWAALRALEEQETLSRRLLDRRWGGGTATQERVRARAEEAHRRASVLREFLMAPMHDTDDGDLTSPSEEESPTTSGETGAVGALPAPAPGTH